MFNRIGDLNPDIPISALYGSKSWMAKLFDFNLLNFIREVGYIDIQVIEDAGHHIYADQVDDFNESVNRICDLTEENSKHWGVPSPSNDSIRSVFPWDTDIDTIQLVTNM